MSNYLLNRNVVFSKDKKSIIRIYGMDMGAHMVVHLFQGNYVVFNVKGYTGWTSLGSTKYYNPTYYLIEINDKGDIVKVIEEIDVTIKTWRQVKKDLISRAMELG